MASVAAQRTPPARSSAPAERRQHGRGVGQGPRRSNPRRTTAPCSAARCRSRIRLSAAAPGGRVGVCRTAGDDVDAVGSGSRVERRGGGHRCAPSRSARQVGEHGMGTDLAQGDGSVQGDHQAYGGQRSAAEIGEVGVGDRCRPAGRRGPLPRRRRPVAPPGVRSTVMRRSALRSRSARRALPCPPCRWRSAAARPPAGAATGTMYGGSESARRPRRSSGLEAPVTGVRRRRGGPTPALSSTTTAAWRTPGSRGSAVLDLADLDPEAARP